MEISALAGKPAPRNMLVDLALLEGEYYGRRPDVGDPNQLVSFGTSGHRGSSLRGTFNEAHILAWTAPARTRWPGSLVSRISTALPLLTTRIPTRHGIVTPSTEEIVKNALNSTAPRGGRAEGQT